MADEDFFEYALKRVSVEAFDALLTCGVRNLAGLLRLTSEDMRSAGLSSNIIAELMDIPLQLKKYANEPETENYKLCEDDAISQTLKEESEEPLCGEDRSSQNLSTNTPIPNNLLERLPTRAKNVLNQENILTIERLLEFQEDDLYCIRGIGRKTVHDIKQLQVKATKSQMTIIHASANETLKVESKCEDRPCPFRRVRCLSRNAEHSISDPADWSLLSRTLPDLYWITLPCSDTSDDEGCMTIAALDISTDDLRKLCEIAIFPEDDADILFSVSLGYLLQVNISDKTFSIMFDYLGRLSGNISMSELFVATAKVADTPVFDDLKTDLIAGFRIPDNLLQNLYEVLGNKKSLLYWSEIEKISERNIIKQLGFTLHGLKTIKSLWQLKEHAQVLITRISAGLPASVYNSFGDLVNAFVRSIIKKEYYYPVLMGRLGFLDERKWTLEELGQRLNLTRERIRQMEKKLAPVLEKSAVIDRLSLLWYAVNESLNLGGGVCCVSEIAHSLKNLWQWHSLPADEALASLISLSPTYEIIWDNPLRVLMPNHVCVNCQVIRTFLIKAVEGRENGVLDISEAVKMMKDFCQGESCEQLTDIYKFSKGFLYYLDDEIDEILADEDSLYTQFAWGVKYGMRRTALVEQIILNVGKAMHFKEVHAEVNKDRPAHGQLSDRSIYGNLERSLSLLMWGPGTFIHKDLVSIPVDLISKIGNDISSRLSTDPIPYLSITGIFENYKDLLLAEDIPNANALYSCVKIVNEQTLDCSDYPYVLKRGGDGLRLPIPLVLETFILEQEGIVDLEQIKHFAIDKLCVNEAVFTISHLPNVPNVLRMSSKEYIHLRQLGIEADKLLPIIDHLKRLLEEHDHVAANLLFNEKKITCRLLGISTPMLLFSLIHFFYSDQFDLSRFPSIRLSNVNSDENRTTGVSLEILAYIRNKSLPCSYSELYKNFVEKLGYNQNTVNYTIYQYKNLLRYSPGVLIHFDSLLWADEKQLALETLATNHLVDRESSGKPFGLVSHLYEYQHDQLPDLPDQIPWTPTLIGELLAYCDKFRIIGTQRDVFVSIPNKYNIESLDDLLYIILDSTYDGAANIDQFISDMCESGILKKNLTSMMLGSESRVVIDGKVVRLARLN